MQLDTFSELEKMILEETVDQICEEYINDPLATNIAVSKKLMEYINHYNYRLAFFHIFVDPKFSTLQYELVHK